MRCCVGTTLVPPLQSRARELPHFPRTGSPPHFPSTGSPISCAPEHPSQITWFLVRKPEPPGAPRKNIFRWCTLDLRAWPVGHLYGMRERSHMKNMYLDHCGCCPKHGHLEIFFRGPPEGRLARPKTRWFVKDIQGHRINRITVVNHLVSTIFFWQTYYRHRITHM